MAQVVRQEKLEIEFKVDGGYRLFRPSEEFLPAWTAYREKRVSWLALRTVCAAHAVVCARCTVMEGEPTLFRVEELAAMMRVPRRRVVRALGELRREELLAFEATTVRFLGSVTAQAGPDTHESGRGGVRVPPEAARLVATPRRLLRAIARGELTRAETAVAVAAVIRCVWVRKGRVVQPYGTLPVSFVEGLFSVDGRSVIRAKRMLEARGFFRLLQTPWWHRQRYGAKYEVSLSWGVDGAAVDARAETVEDAAQVVENRPEGRNEMTPLGPHRGQRLSPPSGNQKPSPTEKLNQHQKPGDRPAAGVHTQSLNPISKPSTPTLGDVRAEDLEDTMRLLELFQDYIRKGYAEGSEAERLRFVAAAERARRKATRNPCGFFVRLVKSRMWENISAIDEEAARERIKSFLWEKPLPAEFRELGAPRPRCEELSDDARFVLEVWRIVERQSPAVSPLEVILKAVRNGSWSEFRYARAERELGAQGMAWDNDAGQIWKVSPKRREAVGRT